MGFALLGAILGFAGQQSASKRAQRAQDNATALAAQQAADQLEFQKEQMALLEEQKQRYREFEFTNPYADMENPFEDMTIAQESARFQAEQGAQQRADIMQQMQGAAGASGIAGLAQALAGQGALQARQISADITSQEQAQQQAMAAGAQAIDTYRRTGDQMVQEAEMQRQSTLLGVAFQGAAGAQSALQSAYANQMSMQMGSQQIQLQNASMYGDIMSSAMGSDDFDW